MLSIVMYVNSLTFFSGNESFKICHLHFKVLYNATLNTCLFHFQLSISKKMWLSIDDLMNLSLQICGEHKESGILRHGFYASPSLQDGQTDVELEVKGKYKGHFLITLVHRNSIGKIFKCIHLFIIILLKFMKLSPSSSYHLELF